jgi:hypothetical protein
MVIKTRLLTSTTKVDKKSNLNTAYFSLGRGTVWFGGSLPTFMANISPSSGSTFV